MPSAPWPARSTPWPARSTGPWSAPSSGACCSSGSRSSPRACIEPAGGMPFTREAIRDSVERAGDEHWRALVAHHEDAYPASRPTPGDVCRAEAERLNGLGLGDSTDLTLVETRVERTDSTIRVV